jgi:hypothetical protein
MKRPKNIGIDRRDPTRRSWASYNIRTRAIKTRRGQTPWEDQRQRTGTPPSLSVSSSLPTYS